MIRLPHGVVAESQVDVPPSHPKQIHTRIVAMAAIAGVLLVAVIAVVKVLVDRNRLAERLENTRRSFDYGMARDDPQLVTRDCLAGAVARLTPAALDNPAIVLALVPHWTDELCIHWVAGEPEANGVEIRTVERREVLTVPLSFHDIERNRVEARTRVFYTNTLRSPEIEQFLSRIQVVRGCGQVVVTLVMDGTPASEPSQVFKCEPDGSLIPLDGSSTTPATQDADGRLH